MHLADWQFGWDQMSHKAVTCGTSLLRTGGRVFISSPGCTVHINTLYSLTKVPISCSFVQRKRRLPLRGRCTNPLEKTSRGLREKKKRGANKNWKTENPPPPPQTPQTPTFPHSPQWAQQHKPSLTSQEVWFFWTSTFCPVMPEQMVANCCLQWRRTFSFGHDGQLGE